MWMSFIRTGNILNVKLKNKLKERINSIECAKKTQFTELLSSTLQWYRYKFNSNWFYVRIEENIFWKPSEIVLLIGLYE